MTRIVWDPGIHLDQLVERQHAMALLEGKQFWGGEPIMSPNFGLPGEVVWRVFQSLCQPGYRRKITPLVGPEGFRGVLWVRQASLTIFHHQDQFHMVCTWFHCIPVNSVKWHY